MRECPKDEAGTWSTLKGEKPPQNASPSRSFEREMEVKAEAPSGRVGRGSPLKPLTFWA